MQLNVNKISSSNLMLNFMSNTSSFDVKFIGGLNPFTITVDGEEIYVYIKNLSPAQLSNGNPDVWRIQLPQKDDFEKIRQSTSLFLLLGYDAENDVYTTWNPYWCKQRLNVGKSVSLYSRLSLQKDVHDHGITKTMPLNNEGVVVCIPPSGIYHYIKNYKYYYPEETTFVPKGSSIEKRKKTMTAESLFEKFCNIGNCSHYRSYLKSIGKNDATTGSYIRNLVFIFETGLIDKYKSVFLQYNNIHDYLKAVVEFKNIEEVSVLDVHRHGYIRTALNHYVRSLIKSWSSEGMEIVADEQLIDVSYPVDEYGKLSMLDDSLVEKLYPYFKNEEFPDFEEMIGIASLFYPTNITDKMTPVDWISLFEKTKWKKTRKKETESSISVQRVRRSNKTIKVTNPDGKIIQESSATETYLYIIENNYPDLIVEIDFGDYVIAKEKMPDFPNTIRHQTQLSNGYYVSTNFDTDGKAKILQRISDELDLGLKIEVLSVD